MYPLEGLERILHGAAPEQAKQNLPWNALRPYRKTTAALFFARKRVANALIACNAPGLKGGQLAVGLYVRQPRTEPKALDI